jgi:hypothetical protein
MRLLLSLLCLGLLSPYAARADALADGLKLLEQGAEVKAEMCLAPVDAFPRDRVPWNAPGTVCSHDPMEAICAAVLSACQEQHGRSGCWAPRPAAAPAPTAEMVAKTKTYFNRLRTSPMVQELCCQDNQACKRHLGKTKLTFNSTRLHRDNARYMLDGHEIRVGMKWLENCRNEQCMERMMLHELAHSCQYSRPMARTGLFRDKLNHECSTFLGHSDIKKPASCEGEMENLLGQVRHSAGSANECLLGELGKVRDARKKQGEPVCWKSWLHEAEADLIFMPLMTDISHWYTMCMGRAGGNHGPPRVTGNCYFKRPEVRQKFGCR